jgi:hypothetical protein
VRRGLRLSVAAASYGVTIAAMPAGSGTALLADVPNRERRDGGPQFAVGGKSRIFASSGDSSAAKTAKGRIRARVSAIEFITRSRVLSEHPSRCRRFCRRSRVGAAR